MLFNLLALPALGYGLGWIKNFPRWSYPYLGSMLLFSLYMMNVATPGFRIFNYTFGSNDLWRWRAWIPFLVMTGVALLVTRALKPLRELFRHVAGDWTLLTFGMLGCMPLLIRIGFDEMDRLYSLPFMVVLTLLMCGTALAYLRSARHWRQVVALLIGILLMMSILVIAPTIYWLENGWVNVAQAAIMGAAVVLVMFSPALIRVVRRI